MNQRRLRIALAGILTGALFASGIGGLYLPAGQTRDLADKETQIAQDFRAAVPTQIAFAGRSPALSDEALPALRAQARQIRLYPGVRFAVTGHAGVAGGDGFDRQLALHRANAVVAALMLEGVPEGQLMALVTMDPSGTAALPNGTVTEVLGFLRDANAGQPGAGFLGATPFGRAFGLTGA